ncbi:MAG TPA: MobA/MobL family protein [Granulicella sp.]|nr:MobA/MobL family protein [Granulicella sp.]
MAIYHLTAQVGSRSGGQSAAAKFAYLCRQGRYGRDTSELLHSESQLLPAWAVGDPALYWKAADRHERANGRLYQQVEIGLPRELSREQQIQLAQSFALELAATPDGFLPYTLVVHRGQDRNPHAHILLSERVADGHDRTPDTWFRRAAAAGRQSPELGGAKKTAAFQPREWVSELRERWANRANAALEQAGSSERVDHRSHAARGIEQRPTVHEGPYALRARERGVPDDRVARNAEIRAANIQLTEIRTHSKTAQMQLDALERQLGLEQAVLPSVSAAPEAKPDPASEARRFIEAHRTDFSTSAEAARWFDREARRLGTLRSPATARGLFEESLASVESAKSDFLDVLQNSLVIRRWQDAPLSVGASIQQARREMLEWRQTAAEIEQQIAGHNDPRSFWRRLWGADQQLLSLERERDSALAQIELHRATVDRLETRWGAERPTWEREAAEKNAQRLEKQHQAAERLRALRAEVLGKLERREAVPQSKRRFDTQYVEGIRRKLRKGLTPEEVWLDLLLLKDYSRQEQDDLETLICQVLAEGKNGPGRMSWS